MTMALSWVAGGNAFIVVDSVVTGGVGPVEDVSSFDERQLQRPKRIEEGAAKLMMLDQWTCAGMVGDAVEAERFLVRLSSELQANDLRTSVNTALAETDGESRFDCLIAASKPTVRIWRVRSNGQFRELGGTCVLGSLHSLSKGFADGLVHEAKTMAVSRTGDFDPDRYLATVLTSMQAYGQRAPLIPWSVGGAFFGVRVDVNGVHWQPDIFYLLGASEDLSSAVSRLAATDATSRSPAFARMRSSCGRRRLAGFASSQIACAG